MEVVIIGGGIAGTTLARQLQGSLGISRVTIIEPKSYMELSPGIIHTLQSDSTQQCEDRLQTVCIPGQWAWPPTKILHIQNHVRMVKPGPSTGTFEVSLDHVTEVEVDVIVIASGTSSKPEHFAPWRPSSTVCTFQQRREEILAYRQRISTSIKPVLIIGGGVIAVEMICTLADEFPSKRFYLLVATNQLIESLAPLFGRAALSNLRKRSNVIVLMNQGKIDIPVNASQHELVDGTKIEFDVVIHAIGALPNTSFCPPDWLDERKAIRVDQSCRIMSGAKSLPIDHAFAIGDCNNLTNDKSSKSAIYQANVVLHNIRNLAIGGRQRTPTYKYHGDPSGHFVSLGRSQALFRLNWAFSVTGFTGLRGSGSLRAHVAQQLVFYKLVFQTTGLMTYFLAPRSLLLKDNENETAVIQPQQ